jgi:hypothetical protein
MSRKRSLRDRHCAIVVRDAEYKFEKKKIAPTFFGAHLLLHILFSSTIEVIMPVPEVRLKKGESDRYLLVCLRFCNSRVPTNDSNVLYKVMHVQ